MGTYSTSGMAFNTEEDQDLHTILALYDSNDLLTKLEDAARVLSEMIPSGLVEHEDILDDALAVVCSDLAQILQLGVKDRSLSALLNYVKDLASLTRQNKATSREASTPPRELLFDMVVELLRSPQSRQGFLALIDDSHSTLLDLYESFAPLRSEDDRCRILKALQLLPHVDVTTWAEAIHETREVGTDFVSTDSELQSDILNGHQRHHGSFLNVSKECPTSNEAAVRPSMVRSHTRSRSDLDDVPASSSRSASSLHKSPGAANQPRRRLSTASSLPDTRSVGSTSSFTSSSSSYFSPPRPGQSLIGYLKSQDTVTCADLDRENAHFFICEAIIAAVQCVQYETRHNLRPPPPQPHSDDSASWTSSQTLVLPDTNKEGSSNSAETIAVSLLKRFSESHYLPKASDLDWILSDCDTPQSQLLPLPKEVDVEAESWHTETCRLRGNMEWAPLRPQVIYHIQSPGAQSTAMAQQKSRCAGCGGKNGAQHHSKMRYCDYTGKYFCVLCHQYKQAIIPARVLLRWDFSKHYVSNFAADFLAKIYREPLFDVSHCSLDLYKRSRLLEQTRVVRTQLVLATQYVRHCRAAADSAMAEIEQLPNFVWQQIDIYSLDLFCSVRDGVFPAFIRPVAELAMQHVLTCQLCSAKGHICEMCRCSTLLFPFQLTTVWQCPQCCSCFHLQCIKAKACPKCTRLLARRSELSHQSPSLNLS